MNISCGLHGFPRAQKKSGTVAEFRSQKTTADPSTQSAAADFALDDKAWVGNQPALQVALEAEDVDSDAPHGVGALEAVGGPLVCLVEALGAQVVDEREEIGLTDSERRKVGACCRDQGDADAEAPGVWIDIEGGELAVVGKVGFMRRCGGGEAVDDVAGGGDDGVGLEGIGVGEIVFVGAVLGAEIVEIAGGEDSAVAVLPGADVDARDGESVGGLGGAEKHGASIARQRAVGSGRWIVDDER